MLFVLKEGFTGFVKARLAAAVAVMTISISLILIGVFLLITVNLNKFVTFLRSRVELEVFLDDSFDEDRIESLGDQIRTIEGVDEVLFISKEMAILEYQKLFRDSQANYIETLGYNPLPASYRVKLAEEHRTAVQAERVFSVLTSLEGVGESNVVYRREYLVRLEKYIKIAIAVDFVVGTIVCLSALLLVSNNIRLIILSKARIIETMKLVGATSFFVRMPLYVQGVIQGFLGGVLAAVFLYGLVTLGSLEIPGVLSSDWRIYVILANFGILLGIAGSATAVRRYL